MTARLRFPRVRIALPLALVLVAIAGSAEAHAERSSSKPPANGHVDVGLTYVEITFTEPVSREYTSLDVIDLQGVSYANGVIQFDPANDAVIRLPVTPLPDGVYSANWRALSADTHTTRGTVLFAVGNATLKYAPPPQASDVAPDALAKSLRDGAARAGFYVGLFAALGAPLFALVVDREREVPRRLLHGVAALAFAGALAGGVILLLFADRVDLDAAAAARTGVGSTIAWRALLLGGAGALLAVAGFAPGRARANLASLAILFAGGALVATALGGHAAATADQKLLSIAMDALHLLMGSVWVGGVLGFLIVAWGRAPTDLGRLVARFTPLAIASVVLLVATGTYASLRQIPTIQDLWAEPFGRLVALKVLLLLPLLALGWYHKARVGPALAAGDASRPREFRRALQAEAVVMVLVLCAAGVLAATPPPRRDLGEGGAVPAAYFEATNQTRTTHVVLQVSPNPVMVGIQNVTIFLHTLTPGPLPNATLVAMKLAAPGEGEPEVLTDLEKVGPGEFSTGEGGWFSSVGTWRVYVILQRPDEYKKIEFEVPVEGPAAS